MLHVPAAPSTQQNKQKMALFKANLDRVVKNNGGTKLKHTVSAYMPFTQYVQQQGHSAGYHVRTDRLNR
jgi:hypothetical protein